MPLNVKTSEGESARELEFDPLVAAVLAGDREAYREIIALCEAKVRVILAAMLPDKESVDDLAQEVFVTAYGKLRNYQPGSDFVAWVKAITRNLALNERRRWLSHQGFKTKFQAEMETVLDPVINSTSERFAGDVLIALRDCLAKLQDPAKGITEGFYFKGQSTEEIARQLNRSSGWVRLALFRARSALATCLQLKKVI